MAPGVIRTVKSLPPTAQFTAKRLEMLGIREGRWSYRVNCDIPDRDHRLQIRDIEGFARPQDVAHLAEMMKPYTMDRTKLVMPPMIVTGDAYLIEGGISWLVDGNTRAEAALKLGWTTFPAFVLDDCYEGAPEPVIDLLYDTGTLFNTTNGKNLPPGNIEKMILRVAKPDDSAYDLSRRLQIGRQMVASVLFARDARERAARLDIDLSGTKLTRSHLEVFGKNIDKLNDEPFRKALTLAEEGKISVGDLKVLLRETARLGTDQEKMERLAAERASLSEVIAGHGTRPPRPRQLRQHLGFIDKYTPGELVEQDPDNYDIHLRAIARGIEKLLKLQAEQYALESKRSNGRD